MEINDLDEYVKSQMKLSIKNDKRLNHMRNSTFSMFKDLNLVQSIKNNKSVIQKESIKIEYSRRFLRKNRIKKISDLDEFCGSKGQIEKQNPRLSRANWFTQIRSLVNKHQSWNHAYSSSIDESQSRHNGYSIKMNSSLDTLFNSSIYASSVDKSKHRFRRMSKDDRKISISYTSDNNFPKKSFESQSIEKIRSRSKLTTLPEVRKKVMPKRGKFNSLLRERIVCQRESNDISKVRELENKIKHSKMPKNLKDSCYYITELRNYHYSSNLSKPAQKYKEQLLSIFKLVKEIEMSQAASLDEIRQKRMMQINRNEHSLILVLGMEGVLLSLEKIPKPTPKCVELRSNNGNSIYVQAS